jgi:hypothetical protein
LRIRKLFMFLPATVASLLIVQIAHATPVTPIDTVSLDGSNSSTWDPTNTSDGCLDSDTGAYAGVDDGSIGGKTDAFDGGLILIVDGKRFVDGDDTGNLVGESLTTGPMAVHGVNVLRTDRAIGTVLRTLIKLTNTRASRQSFPIALDSDLGSDGDGAIRATSSGNLNVTSTDRWFITSDDATSPGDPVLTFVSHGRGQVRSRGDSPRYGHGTECVLTHWRVTVPAHSARYLLVITEMSTTNGAAISKAARFDNRRLNSTLLAAIGPAKRAKVLNWDLT